jgi:hypothetical protein
MPYSFYFNSDCVNKVNANFSALGSATTDYIALRLNGVTRLQAET